MNANKQMQLLNLIVALNPKITVGEAGRKLNRIKRVLHG